MGSFSIQMLYISSMYVFCMNSVQRRLLIVARLTDNHRDNVCFMTVAGPTHLISHIWGRLRLCPVVSCRSQLRYNTAVPLAAPAAFTATMFSVVKWRLVHALAEETGSGSCPDSGNINCVTSDFVKLGSCSSLLKFLNSTLKFSM